jgi:hypothetical protein
VLASDGVITALFAGDTGLVRYRDGMFDTLDPTPRTGAVVVALPGGKLAVVCGGPTLRVDAATGAIETFSTHAETGCAAAATRRHLVIALGSAVEIDDVTTLGPVASATLAVPRTGASAIALPNDQVMIAGGLDGSGAPVAAIDLFTPAAP